MTAASVLTVTLNSALDQVLLVDELIPGQSVQARSALTCVGGKGLDTSVALRSLGVPTVGLSFMAGAPGRKLAEIIKGYGIEPETVEVGGETRVLYVIAESGQRRVSHIRTGALVILPEHLADFIDRYRNLLGAVGWVVLAGSLPAGISPGIYAELAAFARQADVSVLIDSLGPPLLEALKSRPTVVKMNQDEFNMTFEVSSRGIEDLCEHAARIYTGLDLQSLVITCGAAGIVAVARQTCFHVQVPPQPAVNPAGAGDAASAGLIWRLSQGDGWPEALKWAGAVSAASVLTAATAELSLEDARRIYPEITLVETAINM